MSLAWNRAPLWALALLVFVALVATAPGPLLAKPGAAKPSPNAGLCRPQKAQEFLKRPHFVRKGRLDARRNDRSLRFRVERYGRVDGIGLDALNHETVHSQITGTRFFDLPIQLHRAVVPALKCVERRIRKVCTKPDQRYKPRALGGYRPHNTFRGGEVSNHMFGIAVDIDPDRNPCCGCVQPWPEHPACQGDAESVFDRTELPRCWIYAFERYGSYWLGRDPHLRDTMHFEFLGDPSRILTR